MFGQRTGGSEKLRHRCGQQQSRMERTATGACAVDDKTVGIGVEQDGQDKRHGRHQQSCREAGSQRSKGFPQGDARQRGEDHMADDDADQQPDRQISDLIPPQHHEACDNSRGETIGRRGTVQRTGEEQPGDRPVGKAENLSQVLDAPGG